MESNDQLRKADIKNGTCSYFDDMIRIEDFDINDILIDDKPYENIFLYKISYKSLINSQPLRIRFEKIDGFVIVCDRTRYLVLFGSEKYDHIYNTIRYLISVKRDVTNIISYNFGKIKVYSYDSLPLEKIITFYNVIILIKSVWNKDKNNYYYHIFLRKASYELPKK